MNTFPLRILTYEKPFFEGECESLIAPTSDGLYGILAKHCDAVAAVGSGELQYRPAGEKNFTYVAVSPGVLSVRNGEVTVLVETAEKASDIDFARAMKQYEHAKNNVQTAPNELARRQAEMKLSRAVTRLKVHSGRNK